MFRIINSSINLPKIDKIEMVVKGDTEIFREIYVSLSVYYADGTRKNIYNNPFPFPEYEVISLIELEFDDTATVTSPDGIETTESSTIVFNEMPDADIDAIIDTFNSIINLALSDIDSSHNKVDRFRDDVFQFHATIRNGKGVID